MSFGFFFTRTYIANSIHTMTTLFPLWLQLKGTTFNMGIMSTNCLLLTAKQCSVQTQYQWVWPPAAARWSPRWITDGNDTNILSVINSWRQYDTRTCQKLIKLRVVFLHTFNVYFEFPLLMKTTSCHFAHPCIPEVTLLDGRNDFFPFKFNYFLLNCKRKN